MTTICQLLSSATEYLSSFRLESPREDAELILATATNTNRTHLLSHPEQRLALETELCAWRWVEKRAQHYPIQYMRGFQEFYGREFLVTPDVLIPRPETELLIDVSLELLECEKPERILDIGTGSGCLAITLLLESPSLLAVAIDIMETALAIARVNARRNDCAERLRLLHGDTARPLHGDREKFDLVISNPPYVAFSDRAMVSPSVARFEPSVAVFAENSGMEVFQRLFDQVPGLLAEDGHLVLELGYGQNAEVSALGRSYGWVQCDLRKDLANIERCAVFHQA